ncbi:hypothetical protein PF001_g1806 [Phytophthora fragariae]|uniref:Uncharacterized protein n=1 Tax=Phytophthora fragariae TaxID=53985 RepID=A0A6A4ESM4_9STRA|nr:hypothetical protein PF001_g1806 [Phytophthora fragariae]
MKMLKRFVGKCRYALSPQKSAYDWNDKTLAVLPSAMLLVEGFDGSGQLELKAELHDGGGDFNDPDSEKTLGTQQ